MKYPDPKPEAPFWAAVDTVASKCSVVGYSINGHFMGVFLTDCFRDAVELALAPPRNGTVEYFNGKNLVIHSQGGAIFNFTLFDEVLQPEEA